MAPSRRAVLAGGGTGLAALAGGAFWWDRWQPGSSRLDWPMVRYDAAGTSAHPAVSGPKSKPRVRWHLDVEQSSSLIRVGSTLYATAVNELAAIDAESGTERFRIPGTATPYPPVRVDASSYETATIAVRTRDDCVGYNTSGGLLGTRFGSRRWRSPDSIASDRGLTDPAEQAGYPKIRVRWLWGTPVANDGTLYTPTGRGGLVAIDANDGRALWHWKRGALGPVSRPVVDGGTVFLASTRTLVALRATDGEHLWNRPFDQRLRPPTVTDSKVIVPHGEGIRAVAPDGSIAWERSLDVSRRPSTRAAATDDVVVFGFDGTLYAVDAATGRTLWTAAEFSVPPIIADGVVYTSDSHRLVALDLDTGEQQFTWDTYPLRDRYSALGRVRPALVGDGRVYATAGNHLFALEER